MSVIAAPRARSRPAGLTRSTVLGLPIGVWLLAGLVVVALIAVAGAYGFHRDEMYFILAGRHPDWGYDDQPPITPLLAAGSAQLFGTSPLAIRILPALAVALIVVLTADMARRLGASARGQVLAAIVVGGSMLLGAGHLMATATFDILGWTAIVWLLLPVLALPDDAPTPWRRWIVLGLVAGLALQNKHLPVFLAVCLLAGLVVARRARLLRSPALWAALATAFVIWLPNVAWQAAHGFPQLNMASGIASDQSGLANRLKFFIELMFLAGPLLFPVLIAGAIWLLRAREARAWRPVGFAVVFLVALMLLVNGKSYYAAGFFPILAAAGAGPLERWLERGRRRLRESVFSAATILSVSLVAVVALPIVPVGSLHSTPIPDLYSESAAQVGWPELARQTEAVVATLTPAERASALIVTPNYGVYGALELYGSGLPPVYSGHVSVYYWGEPKDGAAPVILVAWRSEWTTWGFRGCRDAATIDNGYAVPTEEQGASIFVCEGTTAPWPVLWPEMRHDS